MDDILLPRRATDKWLATSKCVYIDGGTSMVLAQKKTLRVYIVHSAARAGKYRQGMAF